MSVHALLINSSKAVPLAQLRELADVRLSVVTEPRFAVRYAGQAEVRSVSRLSKLHEVLDAALDLHRKAPIDCVIAPSERSILAAGMVRSRLGLAGPSFDTCLAFTDKRLMKQRLRAAGLPVADWTDAADAAGLAEAGARIGWPVIAKPAFGVGCQDTHVLRSADEAQALAASDGVAGTSRDPGPLGVARIVERFLAVEAEYHCDGVVHGGDVVFEAVARYHAPVLEMSEAFAVGAIPVCDSAAEHREIVQLHRRAVAALGLESGVTHMEVLRAADEFFVGEIACRLGGGGIVEAVGYRHGVDLWRAFLETSLGLAPTISALRRARLVAECGLPIRNGVVKRISAEAELAALPGVIAAHVTKKPGDVVDEKFHSSTTAGYVFFEMEDESEFPGRVAALRDAYVFETE